MDLIKLLRPLNWLKNLFIFVPIFFARDILNQGKFESAILAFVVFSLVASCVYIINDLSDREEDKKHSIKKDRPLASGKVKVRSAIAMLVVLLAASGPLLYFFIPAIFPYILFYFLLNLAYTFYLKFVAVMDILTISGFYLLRVIAGGAAAALPVSHWLLLCVIFLSLFLIIAKRKAEFSQGYKRGVLSIYTPQFLDALSVMALTLTVISYSLYTVLVLNSNLAVYSIFFVLMAVIRYLLLVYTSNRGEYPEKVFFSDPVIITAIAGWILLMVVIFYK